MICQLTLVKQPKQDTSMSAYLSTVMIEMKQASLADLVAVSTILKEAADWLRTTGRAMWREDELNPDRIYKEVEAGSFYLAVQAGEPAGTIKFQLEDSRFWPDLPGSDAAYVHRIAVKRQFAGKGISSKMLKWAVSHADSLGRSYLRLDCEADRQALRAIYEQFGFRLHSYRDVGPYRLSRYEYIILGR
jgi:ribosomal protein S18 acetylase RimI-like enzyme